jgi:hypothetical protein
MKDGCLLRRSASGRTKADTGMNAATGMKAAPA